MDKPTGRTTGQIERQIDRQTDQIRRGKITIKLASVFITGISNDSGQKFTESKSINLSLSTLGKVIQCLSTEKPAHIPYRESKLTRILQVKFKNKWKFVLLKALIYYRFIKTVFVVTSCLNNDNDNIAEIIMVFLQVFLIIKRVPQDFFQ
jgi:hypothetical protein